MKIRIVLSTPNYLIAVKPEGLLSESPGLPDLLREQEKLPALHPVHRLDQTTGGLLLIAKNPEASAVLQTLFQSGKVIKEYKAIACGTLTESEGYWSDLLFHDKSRNKTYVVRNERKGVKKAELAWIRERSAEADGTPVHLVRVSLHTGRTHQIRVQFASRGFPLLGDRKYGCRIKKDGIALWASRLCFKDPFTGEMTDAVSDPPESGVWAGLF